MSLSLILPTATAADWQPVSLPFDYKSIFRTSPAEALPSRQAGLAKAGPALKIAAEALTLFGVSAGLFSLFLGLSIL